MPETPGDRGAQDGGPVRLSVLVTIVDGGETLRRCLDALTKQEAPPPLEVIVPYDASLPWAPSMANEYPEFRFLDIGQVRPERPISTPAGQHELYDRRRAAGLAAATGRLIGMLEDRGVPDPEWAATVDRVHRRLSYAVVGGAVEPGAHSTLAWAVYFCDFSRYQLPLEPGPREYVTDVNITYKREALERTRELWKDRYHETTVHWALARAGDMLYLTPEFVVRQMRTGLRLGSVLRERYDWGRLFAYTRARESSRSKRIVLAVLSPALPLALFLRLLGTQWRKRTHFGRFLQVAPAVAILLAAWSLGELAGYLTGRT